jgi:ElaB/YqjD/DUF883 family membrane-anchored ribosome-binding protein
MYKQLQENAIQLQNDCETMMAELTKAIERGNKTAMKRFRSLSNKISKSLKEFRKETLNIEKGE